MIRLQKQQQMRTELKKSGVGAVKQRRKTIDNFSCEVVTFLDSLSLTCYIYLMRLGSSLKKVQRTANTKLKSV